jgi:hypothetical protein
VSEEQRQVQAVLRNIENDWREALEAIEVIHAQERDATRKRLAAIHRNYRGLALWQVLNSLALVVIVVVGFVIVTSQNDKVTGALCALRQDLSNRVVQTDKFVAEHPHGIPGIPAATLRVQADGQRRTIAALGGLSCR